MTLAVPAGRLPGIALAAWGRRWWRPVRSLWCVAVIGGHELYRAHSETRLYQRCVLCGHETTGWTIDRRDRRVA